MSRLEKQAAKAEGLAQRYDNSRTSVDHCYPCALEAAEAGDGGEAGGQSGGAGAEI